MNEKTQEEKWIEEFRVQELTITMRFPIRMNPGNEGHLKQVAMAYLKPKGVVVYEEEGKIIIE